MIWKIVVGALIVGSLIGGGWLLDDRYAKADDAKQNKSDITINGLKDNIRWYQDQMSYIKTRCNVRDPNKLPPNDYQTYENYRIQKEQLDLELQVEMRKKY